MVDSITTVGTTAQSQSDVSFQQYDEDYTMFLNLLTTQLQNQDPTSPMDTNEMTNQIVQFTSVEQQIQTNSNLEDLTALMTAQANSDITGYLGQDVLISGGTGLLQNGAMEWEYTLPTGVANSGIAIFNEQGDQIASYAAEQNFGTHTFNWDGTDSDGNPVEAGVYEMRVLAFDSEQNALSVPESVVQRITEIEMTGLEPTFIAGNQSISRNDMLKLISAN